MAQTPGLIITAEWTDLAAVLSLTDGQEYLVQLVNGDQLLFVDFASDPTGEPLIPNIARCFEWIAFESSVSEPTWFRSRGRGSCEVAVKTK